MQTNSEFGGGRGGEVVELIAYLIGDLVTPLVGRTFFRIVKRFPLVFAAVALVGEAVGVWAVGFWAVGDWFLVGIGLLCLTFYTGLLALLAVKLWAGTWGEFCNWGASLFRSGRRAKRGVAPDPAG